MRLIEAEYMENARRMGDYLLSRFANWPNEFRFVGDIRGKGLMIGIEIVLDKKTKERAHELRDRIVYQAFTRGLLVLGAGEYRVLLSLPLIFDDQQAVFSVRTLADSFRDVE